MSSATQELFHRLTTTASVPGSPSPSTESQSHYHNELQKLRDEGDSSYLFLRTILELTSSSSSSLPLSSSSNQIQQKEELLFHCILGFRHVLLFSWMKFNPEFKILCRDYLFALGIHHCIATTSSIHSRGANTTNNHGVLISKIIGNTCLAASASFWKRGWDDNLSNSNISNSSDTARKTPEEEHLIQLVLSQSNIHNQQTATTNANTNTTMQIIQSTKDLFTLLESYIQQDVTLQEHTTIGTMTTIPKSIRASYFLSTLINEFNGSSNVAQYNCSLDFHRCAHLHFEQGGSSNSISYNTITAAGAAGLVDVLRIAMNGLGGIVSHLEQQQQQHRQQSETMIELGNAIVTLTNDILSWEFGSSGGHWGGSTTSGSSGSRTNNNDSATSSSSVVTSSSTTLVRPPEEWREYLIRPDFLGAIFQVYMSLRRSSNNNNNNNNNHLQQIQHSLRQLLLLLSSITGIVFEDKNQRLAYCGFLVDGCLNAFSTISMEWKTILSSSSSSTTITTGAASTTLETADASLSFSEAMEKEIIDFCCMITKLVYNFKVEAISQLPSFTNLLSAITSIGELLLQQHVHELRSVQGDMDCVEGYEWRDEALAMLLEAVELLVDDYWLLSVREGNAQDVATQTMSSTLSQLYTTYIQCRIEMAKMEEYYVTANAADLDEVREEIASVRMEEEMTAASSLGRLNLSSSLECLKSLLLQGCLPRLQELFDSSDAVSDVSPDAAALLEQARLLVVCICHLLTDECSGEEPTIPERVMNACSPLPSTRPSGGMKRGSSDYSANTASIGQIVQAFMTLGEFQASKIALNPHNPNLSPFLAKTLVWFFLRFGPAYILPSTCDYNASQSSNNGGNADDLISTWSSQQTCHQILSFCMTLSLHYLCYWPHEKQVQETSVELLLALAKRDCNVRKLLINTPSMDHLVNLHKLTAMIVHSTNQNISQSSSNDTTGLSQDMILGYKRLPYRCRSQMLSVILIASSEINDPKSESIFNSSLESVQNSFHQLCYGLESSANTAKNDDINTKELVCLCVELYAGVARSSEMTHPERVPIFITPSLSKLSDLMIKYASDITICESLLRLFRDYTEQFIIRLDRHQSLVVFRASAGLLKQYSTVQCTSRVIRKPTKNSVEEDLEEEQSYNDILCAIQLLLNIGAKEFINTFSSDVGLKEGINSNEVTDVIFFGLQQILPLMTQGLLQYPTLCKQYYSLVGFMMDTYPQKVGGLPYDLFNALLDSLLFGMSHVESDISRSSLDGIAALAREQIESQTLNTHLSHNPSLFEICSARVLKEVVFQSIIWDRLECTGMALLPLAAVDMNRFALVVTTLSQQIEDVEKQKKLQGAFQELMKVDVVSKVANGNCGGRHNRLKFKKDFEVFVKDVHSSILVF